MKRRERGSVMRCVSVLGSSAMLAFVSFSSLLFMIQMVMCCLLLLVV